MRFLIFSSLILATRAVCTEGSGHCKSCSDEITCAVCDDHYYVVDPRGSSPCAECHYSCLHCTGPGEEKCTKCTEDKYKEGQGDEGKCLRCSLAMDNCGRCSDSSNCLWCVHPYYLDGSGACVECNKQENCYHCKDSTKCESCAVNYYPDPSGTCVSIFSPNPIPNCIELFYGKCLKCDVSYYLKDENTCDLCTNINFCSNCDGKACIKCNSSYYLKDSITCASTTSINNCEVVEDGGCKKCREGYYKEGNFKCAQCDTSCKDCKGPANTDCSNCKNTNFLNITDDVFGIGKCTPCSEKNPNCEECELSAACTKCNSIYHRGYSSTEKMDVCRKQDEIEKCKAFTVAAGCTDCDTGFYVKDTITCEKCDDFCADCKVAGSDSCTTCDEYHYLYKEDSSDTVGECMKCATSIENCLTCNLNGVCVKCDSTFYLVPADPGDPESRESCSNCFVPCTECNGPEVNQCTNCTSAHFLKSVSPNGETCVDCAEKTANCVSCDLDGNCNDCGKGFYVKSSAKCEVCDAPCAGCKTSGNTQCTDCLDTHYLEENPGVCTECSKKTANCTNCYVSGECFKCSDGNYLSDDKTCKECWTKTTGCRFCTAEGACTRAQDGYYMDGGSHDCHKCDESCATCIAEGSSSCIGCPNGYYMQPGISIGPCLKCPIGCSGCTSARQCTGCETNFTLVGSYCRTTVGPSFGGRLFPAASVVVALLIVI